MGGFAWVTLATNDSYSLGALVLAHSLKQAGTKQQLVVLVTPGVTLPMREKLASVFNVVQEVNILDSKDETNLRLLKRPELGITFTKLHCWRLTQFDKCVFLDADTLVLQNCDELFEREELSAAPDVGWPDCFNSGVFVFKPSSDTYEKLVSFALEKGSFDGGDQGLLNLFFSDWAHKDISKHLPFIYNMCSTACYSYLPAFKQFGQNAKIVHFIGATKPWLQYFDSESKKVHPSADSTHLSPALQRWWDIFCNYVHCRLTPDMARNVVYTDFPLLPSPPLSPLDKNPFFDPWEEYDKFQNTQIEINETVAPNGAESHDTSACAEPIPPQIFEEEPIVCTISPTLEEPSSIGDSSEFLSLPISGDSCSSYEIISTPEISVSPPVPQAPYNAPPETTSEPAGPANEPDSQNLNEEDIQHAGLAGAFAQLTLGAPRSTEQTALEDHLRRQSWEVGNIDYMGRDSFDNIWRRISQTLSSPPLEATPETTEVSTEVTSPVARPTEEPPVEATKVQEPELESAKPLEVIDKNEETRSLSEKCAQAVLCEELTEKLTSELTEILQPPPEKVPQLVQNVENLQQLPESEQPILKQDSIESPKADVVMEPIPLPSPKEEKLELGFTIVEKEQTLELATTQEAIVPPKEEITTPTDVLIAPQEVPLAEAPISPKEESTPILPQEVCNLPKEIQPSEAPQEVPLTKLEPLVSQEVMEPPSAPLETKEPLVCPIKMQEPQATPTKEPLVCPMPSKEKPLVCPMPLKEEPLVCPMSPKEEMVAPTTEEPLVPQEAKEPKSPETPKEEPICPLVPQEATQEPTKEPLKEEPLVAQEPVIEATKEEPSCPLVPQEPQASGVPGTPTEIPSSPISEVPEVVKDPEALGVEPVVLQTPPPPQAGVPTPTPPPRKSSGGGKKSKSKK